MKRLSRFKFKKLLTSLMLDAIQMALLLALMVYSQVIAMRVMITCFPDETRKGSFGSFIAAFLVTVLCAVMLWMVLLILDRYKVMLFGNSFPTFWNSGKPTTKKLADCVARIPQPLVRKNLWTPIHQNMDFSCIHWNGIVFLVVDDGEIILSCGNLDYWSGCMPEDILGDEDNPVFKDNTRQELTAFGKEATLTFAGYFNLDTDAEVLFRNDLIVPEQFSFDNMGRLVVLQKSNFLLIYENDYLEVLSYHDFITLGSEVYCSCPCIKTTHQDCNHNRTKRELKIGVPLKYIVNLDRCCLTDCRILFDKMHEEDET